MRTQKGFTLIELLVVIAIIAVLAGALLIAINPQAMIQKGRDSKRLQDVDTLVKAINLALADSEILLSAGTDDSSAAGGGTAVDGSGYVTFTIPTGKVGLSKFVSTLPTDPINDTCTNAALGADTCLYYYSSTTTGFEINAVMEHPDNLAKMTADGGDNADRYESGTTLTQIN